MTGPTPDPPAGSAEDPVYQLALFVAGETPRSRRAVANLQRLCEEHLAHRYRYSVIDLAEHPALARADQIVAVPTLLRRSPPPVRRVVGDLSDTARVLDQLELEENP